MNERINVMKPEKMIAFLFDAMHESFARAKIYNYGTPCEDSFLRALDLADPHGTCGAKVVRGDLLVDNVVSKMTQLTVGPPLKSKRGVTYGPSVSRHMQADRRSLATLIGDLTDSFKGKWTSLDVPSFGTLVGKTMIYSLTTFPMDLDLAHPRPRPSRKERAITECA